MPSLAQRLRDEGKDKGIEKEKIATARRLIKRGADIDTIEIATELSKEEIEKLAETVH